jgi:OOP family OmpA-OmpF porin
LLTDGNYAHVSPLIKTKTVGYLDNPFTLEFDSYSTGGYLPHIYFYASAAGATAASGPLVEVNIGSGNSHGAAEISNSNMDLTGNYPSDISSDNYMKKWHHIAIAYKDNQMKVYVDQYRVLVAPNIGYLKPKAFDIEGIGNGTDPIIVANVRVANGGGMNMLGKKFTAAKIVTHGINFDIDQSTIKPESMGTLNMIKNVLNDNPDLKFEIDGHTDNSGISAHNMVLSQQRADAVKNQLISMGIDGSRLTTKGFGDSKPIGNNSTDDGRANNRRVEFVRM